MKRGALKVAASCSMVIALISAFTQSVDAPAPVPSSSTVASTTLPPNQFKAADWRAVVTTTTSTTSTTAPRPPVPPTTELVCLASEARAFIAQLLAPYDIPEPQVIIVANVTRSGYAAESGVIVLAACESLSGIAHEVGHYVHDRAFGFNWSLVEQDALQFFTHTDWIAATESSPGIEHAAHCIGNVLYGYGTYTKCPDWKMREHAIAIVAAA